MTKKSYLQSITYDGNDLAAIDNRAGYDVVTIGARAEIVSLLTTGIWMSDHQRLNVDGSVYGDQYGIVAGKSQAGHTTVNISRSGVVQCGWMMDAIQLRGHANTVTNAGRIHGDDAGIDALGSATSITNTGKIDANMHGIAAEGSVRLVNTGTITSHFNDGIIASGSLQIVNKGLISAVFSAIDGSDRADVVLNSGRLHAQFVSLDGGNDVFSSTHGRTDALVQGGSGNDRLYGGAFSDRLHGDAGADKLNGNGGRDTLEGGAGHDVLDGGSGNDRLTAGAGNDILTGGLGNDVLDGGVGYDRVRGGLGADTFVFNERAAQRDAIADFSHAQHDRIQLGHTSLAALVRGSLDPGAFHLGTVAQDAGDRIIYDRATGHLFYDADGDGDQIQELILTLTNHAALAADDFLIT